VRAELLRLVRFALVGASNTALTLAAFAVLTGLGAASPVASALGFAVGAANGYVLNRRWTFRCADHGAAVVGRYVAVQAVGAGLSAVGVAFATSDLDLRRLAAEAIVIPVVTLVTYSLSRRLVFAAAA
jgi:putative flippase GtrA